MDPSHDGYDGALGAAAGIYPGLRVGRPGRSRGYGPFVTGLQLIRAGVRIDIAGKDNVAPGPAILVGNHVSGLDPFVVVAPTWWRVHAFAKVELFESKVGFLFRMAGQIPLRRGDAESTAWAMDMARRALADGRRIGIYPEGTRGPDKGALYRFHTRVLLPLMELNPDVPVHVVSTTYGTRSLVRLPVRVRISTRVPVDVRTMTPEQITDQLRDAMLEQSGLRYVDEYAGTAKRRARDAAAPEPGTTAD